MARARAEGPFSIDLGSFPLVRMSSPSASEYERVHVASFFTCADRAAARRAPFVLLHDARGLPYVDEPRKRAFLALLLLRRRALPKHLLAYAAVASTPLERGLITALAWSANLPIPTRIFATELEAQAFLLDRYSRIRAARDASAVRPYL